MSEHLFWNIMNDGETYWEWIRQGSHPTWKTWNFVIYFYRPGKYMEFALKTGKNLEF